MAEVTPTTAKELSLEAPLVAYVLDGDDAGKAHAKKLRAAGVHEDTIVFLEDGLCLEDYIAKDKLLEAINEQLRRSHGNKLMPDDAIGSAGRAQGIEEWCAKEDIKSPSKVRLASHLVAIRSRGLVDANRSEGLRSVLKRLEVALQKSRGM